MNCLENRDSIIKDYQKPSHTDHIPYKMKLKTDFHIVISYVKEFIIVIYEFYLQILEILLTNKYILDRKVHTSIQYPHKKRLILLLCRENYGISYIKTIE